MKRIIIICLAAIVVTSSSSFTSASLSEGSRTSLQAFKRYTITISATRPIPNSSCTLTVWVMISFWWNGPGTPVTNVEIFSTPSFQLNCPPSSVARDSKVIDLAFDEETGYLTNIDFEQTGESAIDAEVATFLWEEKLLEEINAQIEEQK